MINIILIGCLGRLGSEISNYVCRLKNYKIVSGVDICPNKKSNSKYNVYSSTQQIINNNITADVVIDFSNPSALQSTLEFCKQTNTPLVLGTTGINNTDKEKILNTSKFIPIFWSVNMSFGINILANICENIIKLSNDLFDIDIIEKHHNKKIDAPSGTANMIAKLIKTKSENLYNNKKNIIDNNYNLNQPRNKDEIRIHSIRAGNITGEHTVIFNYGYETLSVSHTSSSKEVFAQGAIKAVDFLIKQPPGLYKFIN